MSSFKTIKLFLPLAFLLIFLLLPVSIQADPVAISGGTLTYSRSGGTPFTLTGSGMVLNGSTSSLNAFVSLLGNGTLAQGQTGFTSGSLDSQDGELSLSNPITIGSSVYNPGASLLVLNISSGSFTVPIETASGFVVVAPFVLTAGIVEGYENLLGVGNPLFSNALTGSGTTTLLYLLTPSGEYQLYSQSFSFGSTVSSVTVNTIPEPATLLLLSSGLAGLVGATRRRYGRRRSG